MQKIVFTISIFILSLVLPNLASAAISKNFTGTALPSDYTEISNYGKTSTLFEFPPSPTSNEIENFCENRETRNIPSTFKTPEAIRALTYDDSDSTLVKDRRVKNACDEWVAARATETKALADLYILIASNDSERLKVPSVAQIKALRQDKVDQAVKATKGAEQAFLNAVSIDQKERSGTRSEAAVATKTAACALALNISQEDVAKFDDSKLNESGSPQACKDLASSRAAAATSVEAVEAADTRSETCSWLTGGPFSSPQCFQNFLLGIVSSFVLPIPALILSLSAFVFDYSVYFSIIQFKDILESVGATAGDNTGSSIYLTWVIVRNLFNIVIIFQLLSIAIRKILSTFAKSSGDLKRSLVSIIIFTLFTNFSFFFTKTLIDFSNITALQFYAAMGNSPERTNIGTEQKLGNTAVSIISSFGIKPGLIVGSIVGAENANTDTLQSQAGGVTLNEDSGGTDLTKTLFGVFVLAALLLLVAFILIQGAAIFVARSILLIFLVVFSPLMFARGILGPLEKWSDKWWESLLEQLYTAPIYLGMLYLVLKLAGGGESGGILNIIQGGDNAITGGSIVQLVFPALIMGGLLFGTAKLAKEFGGSAAAKSSAFGTKAFGAVVGGAGGLAARKSIGRVANKISNNSEWKDKAAAGGVKGAFYGGLLNIADRGKKSTFDLRNSTAIKNLDTATGGTLGLKNLGAGAANGFTAERAAADKKREAKIALRTERLDTDTYGLTGEAKKKAEEDNRQRREIYQAVQTITASTTDTEFEKLRKNEANLNGEELAYAREYNKKIEEARVRAKSALGQIQNVASVGRSAVTGNVRGGTIAAKALEGTQKANKKTREDEINKKKAEATKKANESIKKIFESIDLKDNGEERTAEELREQIQIKKEIAQSKIVRYRQAVGPDGNGGTDEERTTLKKLDMEMRSLKNSESRIDNWVKNREDSTWKDSGAPGTPPTTVQVTPPTQ